jgi:integrase
MARMTKRKDGRWTTNRTFKNPITGERRRVYFTGKTQSEVKAKVAAAVERHHAGVPVTDSKRTLGEWLGEWRTTWLKASDRADSTKQNYATVLRVHVEPMLGQVPLDRLTPGHLVRVLNKMEEEGKAGSTRRTVRTALVLALADAKRSGLLAKNVAEATDRPRNPDKEARHLTPEEAAKFLAATEGLRYADALRLALLLGLRRGEVLGLRWEHIDLDRKELRVRGSLVRRNGSLSVAETKTAAGRRTVALGPSAVALLKTHRATQAQERIRAGNCWEDSGYVFVTQFGHPVDPRNLLRAAKIAATKAGLPEVDRNGRRIGVHTLRHSNATARLMSGVPDIVVSADLGHSDPTITKRVYGHVSTSAQRASAEAVEAYFAM